MITDIESPQLLNLCRAHLVAETTGQMRTLEQLARKTGFQRINSGDGVTQADDPSAIYFFFHYHVSPAFLRAMLGAIRSSPDPTVRFAPTIVIIGESLASEIIRLINLGFDDVVSLPEKAPVLEKRFAAQLNTMITYFETADYFGPDRRRMQHLFGAQEAPRREGVFRHRRYTIRRTPRSGTHILSREIVTTGSPVVAPPPPVTDSVHFME